MHERCDSAQSPPKELVFVEIADHLLKGIDWPALAEKCSLTLRETQLAQRFALGEDRADTAAHLEISLATVKFHTRHLYAKLMVHNRTELILRLLTIHLAMGK
jgi:DNA-binding NarL/FixJ family response regulator